MNPLTHLQVTLEVRSYIASPYWSEVEQVVTIQKHSGMNRVRSEDKRDAALRRYLEKQGMTYADYEKLVILSKRPWYKDQAGTIIIPRHQLAGCLVQACKKAPAGARFDPEQLRCLVQLGDFTTNRTERDSIWERFVLPTDGKGNPISNQRRYTKDEVIQDFQATGVVSFDSGDVKQKAILDLIAYAGKYVGVGASRKMGHGRFSVGNVEPATSAPALAVATAPSATTALQR